MKKIYIVEDELSIREILELIFRVENYSVTSFANVKEFTERKIEEIPDLYLFDVMLPDGSGIDLCQCIKGSSENKGIPVILMSAHAQLHHLGNNCKPDDIISKPFDIDNLLQRVKKIID